MSLSGNLSIQEVLMREILNVYSNVRHLQLLNTPQLSLDIKLNLVRGTQITEMSATELLLRPFSAESADSVIPSSYMIPRVIEVAVIICADYTKLIGDSEGSVDIARLLRRAGLVQLLCGPPLADANGPTTAFITGLSKFIQLFGVGYTALRIINNGARNIGRMLALSLVTSSDLCSKAGTLCDAIYRDSLIPAGREQ